MPIDKKKRNFLLTPDRFYSDLDEEAFKRLCTKDVTKKLSYPIYLDFSNEKFQLSSLGAVKAVMKGASSVKELDIR